MRVTAEETPTIKRRGGPSRSRWKAVERAIAGLVGGERVPVSGRTRGWAPDIRHRWLAIEVKSRKSQLKLLAEMMDQARKAAEWYERRGEGNRLPVGIYHQTGSPYGHALVFMRLEDFMDWFGGSGPS